MKKVTTLVCMLFATFFITKAASESSSEDYRRFYDGSSYIFVEGGVEFSVFPDGQFDFVYVGPNGGSDLNVSINTPGMSINYNSGYNYDAYVQYDDYGAVIQIEEVPIYYDEFGRIIQAGRVEIRYTNRRIVRVGGLFVHYTPRGYFSHCTGFISPWYRTYVYRPWHVFYARPFYRHCIVYDYPYRMYYTPIRYSYVYHRTHYHRGYQHYRNSRREFYRPGSRIHYRNGRTAINKDYRPNRRNTAVSSRSTRNDRNGVSRVTNRSNSTDRINRSGNAKVNRNSNTRVNRNEKFARKEYNESRPKVNTYRNRTSSKYTAPKKRSSVYERSSTVSRTTTSKPKVVNRNSSYKRTTSVKRNNSSVKRSNTAMTRKSTTTRNNSTKRSSNSKRERG